MAPFIKFTPTQKKWIKFHLGGNPSTITRKIIKGRGYENKADLVKEAKHHYMQSAKFGEVKRQRKYRADIMRNIKWESRVHRNSFQKYQMNFYTNANRVILENSGGISYSADGLFNTIGTKTENLIKKAIKKDTNVKVYMACEVVIRVGDSMETIRKGTKAVALSPTSNVADYLAGVISEFNALFQEEMYGGYVEKVNWATLYILDYSPFGGSSYKELPVELRSKRACVNVKNEDARCFEWAVLSALHPATKDGNRCSKYAAHLDTLNFTGMEFPVQVRDVEKFELMNNLNINVFYYMGFKGLGKPYFDKKNLQILHHSKNDEGVINLLLFDDNHQNVGVQRKHTGHYVYVKDINKLLGDGQGHTHICTRCFKKCKSADTLSRHRTYCKENEAVRIEGPRNDYLCFDTEKSGAKMQRHECVIYADFESALHQVSADGQTGKTVQLNKHSDVSARLYVVTTRDECTVKRSWQFCGKDAATEFVKQLVSIETELHETAFNVPLSELMKQFQGKKLSEMTTETIQAMKQVEDRMIPVIFHNLAGYDSHFIFQAFKKCADHNNFNAINQNGEKFISFNINKYRFIDSAKFLNAPLASLLDNLENDDKKHLAAEFKDEDDFKMVTQKGFFPYEWFDSLERLKETELPPIECWSSKLSMYKMKPEEYEFCKMMWKRFNMHTFKDFHDLYLKIDVLGLADVFETFRTLGMKDYGLDPAHYYTLPGFSWDACQKYTGAKMRLLKDIDMYTFFEGGIRGGLSNIAHRHAKANNPGCSDYNKKEPHTFLMYWDENNQYPGKMCEHLPVDNFEWMDDETDPATLATASDCIVEVDVMYPKHLHDEHSDYPLLPESRAISSTEISTKSHELLNGEDFNHKNRKLVATLNNRTNYRVHIENLKYAISKGLIVTKFHRGISFTSSNFLKEYIDFNTEKRKRAKNDFEKDFYKLANNAVFGKTMENVRNRCNIKWTTDSDEHHKYISRPGYARHIMEPEATQGGGFIAALDMKKECIKLDKPIYLGFTILDFAKLGMQKFHYDVVRAKYGDKAKLCFTDTDSLAYHIETENAYEDMYEMRDKFDLSNYAKESKYYDPTNKKQLGKFKEELGGVVMQEFVGLRSKAYSYKKATGNEKNVLKGIKRCVAKNSITFDDYKQCVLYNKTQSAEMVRFVSKDHTVHTVRQTKKALAAYDDKRYILADGIHTRALGHWRNAAESKE